MFYKYRIKFINGQHEDKIEEGLLYANSYSDAAGKVVEDYDDGTENIIDIYLSELYETCSCITKEEIDDVFSEDD